MTFTSCPRNLPQHFNGCLCQRASSVAATESAASLFGTYELTPATRSVEHLPAMSGMEWRPTAVAGLFEASVDDVEMVLDLAGTHIEEMAPIEVLEDGSLGGGLTRRVMTPEEVRVKAELAVDRNIAMVLGWRGIRADYDVEVRISDEAIQAAMDARAE